MASTRYRSAWLYALPCNPRSLVRHTSLALAALLLLLMGTAAGSVTRADGNDNISVQEPPSDRALPSRGMLGARAVTVVSAAAEIDGMPTPTLPEGSGTGLLNLTLAFDKAKGPALHAEMTGFVRDPAGNDVAVRWRAARIGTPSEDLAPEGAGTEVILYSRGDIPLGETAKLIVHLTDTGGNSLWLASPAVSVVTAR